MKASNASEMVQNVQNVTDHRCSKTFKRPILHCHCEYFLTTSLFIEKLDYETQDTCFNMMNDDECSIEVSLSFSLSILFDYKCSCCLIISYRIIFTETCMEHNKLQLIYT